MINAHIVNKRVQSSSSDAFSLSIKSSFGEKIGDSIIYMPAEALFLIESGKMSIIKGEKTLKKEDAIEAVYKLDKRLYLSYIAYKDLRKRGYVLKSGLKFGGDFRIYKPGTKPGEEHALWILVCEKDNSKVNWIDFASKSRVANSTRKKLLVCLVDTEDSPSYYEISWTKI